MSLDVVKDLLGLIGSILAIVPFIRDFAQRQDIRRWHKFARIIPAFRRLAEQVATRKEAKTREPSRADMLFVMFGILLLIASFAVSLYISAHAPHDRECAKCERPIGVPISPPGS